MMDALPNKKADLALYQQQNISYQIQYSYSLFPQNVVSDKFATLHDCL